MNWNLQSVFVTDRDGCDLAVQKRYPFPYTLELVAVSDDETDHIRSLKQRIDAEIMAPLREVADEFRRTSPAWARWKALNREMESLSAKTEEAKVAVASARCNAEMAIRNAQDPTRYQQQRDAARLEIERLSEIWKITRDEEPKAWTEAERGLREVLNAKRLELLPLWQDRQRAEQVKLNAFLEEELLPLQTAQCGLAVLESTDPHGEIGKLVSAE